MMTKITLIFLVMLIKAELTCAQDITCDELMTYVQENGYQIGRVGQLQLFDSDWLREVVAYEIEDIVIVVASIKKNEYSFSYNKYVFCGIPRNSWRAFQNGLSDYDTTYGERFHKYIMNYKCNCS